MNGGTHIALTEAVCEALGVTDDAIWLSADFPDRVHDLRVRGVGSHIAGRPLCSLLHFQVPYGRKWRGYAWKKDGSLPLGGPNLPDREVWCFGWPSGWGSIGVVPSTMKTHPLRVLLSTPGYRNAADEMTWPTAASMAAWLGSQELVTAAMLGAILHFVQDAAVWHHVAGWLLNGHAGWEGCLQDAWFGREKQKILDATLRRAARSKHQIAPRSAVERCARETYRDGPGGDSVAALRRAIRYTAAVVRRWEARWPR